MEYLYIAMFLQEVGQEISESNIQKIFAALNIEADSSKLQFLIPALSILATGNQKKVKKAIEPSLDEKLSYSQTRLDALENSMTKAYEMVASLKKEQPIIREANLKKEEVQEVIEPKWGAKNNLIEKVEYAGRDTITVDVCHDEEAHEQPARYIYGVADSGKRNNFGAIGLEGTKVYTIPYKDICAVVHDCLDEPYKSEDEEVVKEWLFTQQEVLDVVAEKFGVVLPMSFDMIIEGKNGSRSEKMVAEWLEKSYDDFREKLIWLRNKQEFGVQVILDTEVLSKKLFETDEKLRIRKKEIDAKPEGIAYMEREILKDLVKEKIEEKADQYFREFYSIIKKCTEDIVIGKAKKVGGNKQMLMNLSCLVKKDMVVELGKELEKIENKECISVRFSGPWAPYSFVTPEKGMGKDEKNGKNLST